LEGRFVPSVIAHHLIEVTDRPDLRLVLANGCGTCTECHNQVHKIPGEVERFAQQMQAKGYGISQPITLATGGWM
jgi:hypothetical protein